MKYKKTRLNKLNEILNDNENIYHMSEILIMFYHKYISIWWDDEYFNWKYSYQLCLDCPTNFQLWWNHDKFIYNKISVNFLDLYCNKYYTKWFNENSLKIIDVKIITEKYLPKYKLWFYNYAKEEDKLWLIQKFGVV